MKTIHIKPNRKLVSMYNTNNPPREAITFIQNRQGFTWSIITMLSLACCCFAFLSCKTAVAESTTFTINNNNVVLELTVPSSISIELNPTSGTDYDIVNLPIGIGTNNQYGYTLSMNISSSTLTRTSDVLDGSGNTITPTPTINSITTSFSPSSFASSNDTINTWGYKLATNTNYLPIPTSTTPLRVTTSPSNSTNITTGTGDINLNFAAKVDTTTPAGTYQTTINFTAVTNHPSITINDLTYMQDFATLSGTDKDTVIDYMVEGGQYTLIDNRDNNTYTVSKLCMNKTGNTCTEYDVWMTQNLDFLIGGTYDTGSGTAPIVLTSENTDLNQYDTNGDGTGTTFTGYTYNNNVITWTPTASTMTGSPATISGTTVTRWSNNTNAPYMAEGGDTYSVQGTRYNSLALCEANGTRTKADCMHYHVGNYYNWSAAVAMSNTSNYTTNMAVMPNSICPKGWKLPNGLTDENSDGTADKASDFNYLLKDYGITGHGGTSGLDLVGSVGVGWATNGYTNIGLAPLYFARSGYLNSTSLYGFSTVGVYWSSTVRDGNYAYGLDYDSSGLYPAYRGTRNYGWSVRCMAR